MANNIVVIIATVNDQWKKPRQFFLSFPPNNIKETRRLTPQRSIVERQTSRGEMNSTPSTHQWLTAVHRAGYNLHALIITTAAREWSLGHGSRCTVPTHSLRPQNIILTSNLKRLSIAEPRSQKKGKSRGGGNIQIEHSRSPSIVEDR